MQTDEEGQDRAEDTPCSPYSKSKGHTLCSQCMTPSLDDALAIGVLA